MAYKKSNPNGQATMASSEPVVIASNQSAVPISAASLPLPTGASTESTLALVSGTDVTTPSPAMPAGGVGIRGWLSAIWTKLNASLAVTGTFWQATQPVSGTFWQATQPISLATLPVTNAGTFAVQAAATLAAETTKVIGTVNLAATPLPAIAEIRAATLHVTATAAVNTAITATLPAAGVGLFHYITSVQLVKLYAVVGVAAGAGVVLTSTNLPGTPAWTTEQAAGVAGTAPTVIVYEPTTPLKSAAANIATTFVAPAQLQTIWRWNISYFTGT